MKGRLFCLPTWLNAYRLRRHRRQSKWQRRPRRRNMIELLSSSSSSTTYQTTKVPPRGQQWLNTYCLRCPQWKSEQRIHRHGRSDGHRTGWTPIECAMFQATTIYDAIYAISGVTRMSNDVVERTENLEIKKWLLCYWCMKEQYDWHLINTLKKNIIVNLNVLTIPLLI